MTGYISRCIDCRVFVIDHGVCLCAAAAASTTATAPVGHANTDTHNGDEKATTESTPAVEQHQANGTHVSPTAANTEAVNNVISSDADTHASKRPRLLDTAETTQ